MAFIQIDRSGNFAIRLMHRTAFEFCDHFLMKFSLDNCSCVDHPELYRTNISLSNVEDCNGMSFSVSITASDTMSNKKSIAGNTITCFVSFLFTIYTLVYCFHLCYYVNLFSDNINKLSF